jgi:hypothetical protein
MFLVSNGCIPITNTLGRNAVMSCEGRLILLCKTELHLVTAVHKFDSRLIVIQTSNKRQPAKDIETYDFDKNYMFSLQTLLPSNV